MQKDSYPCLLPNTFRDSNEIPSTRQEVILPSAPSIEQMDFTNAPRHSIIRPAEPDSSLSTRIELPNSNRATNKPFARSIIHQIPPNDDERPAQEQPEQLYHENLINDNHNSLLEAAGYDPSQLAEVDADAAYALQLQQEEYARESLIPNRHNYLPFRVEPDDESSDSNPAILIDNDIPQFTNDEEFATYLQEQENRNRSRYRQPPPFPFNSTNRRSNPSSTQTSETEEPSPFMRFPQRLPANNEGDDDDDDVGENPMHNAHAFLQFLANSGRTMPEGFPAFFSGLRRGRGRGRGRRTGNLQDTEEDFGPEDYERLLQLDESIHKKKLSKHQIDTIHQIEFQPKANNTDEENKCGVCLELFEERQPLREFPCKHVYHKDCADRWLQENNVCPICRKPPIQTQLTSHPRHHRGTGGSRRPGMSNSNPSNRNNNSNNSTNTHRRGPAPHRQS